jgi:hypothetical protein
MSLKHGNFFTDVRIQPHFMTGGYELAMFREVSGKQFGVQLQPSPTETPPGAYALTHMLTPGEAQLLLDALLDAGVKPTGKLPPPETSETYSAGKVEAMKEHLADLRRMAFGVPLEAEQVIIEVERHPDTPRTRADEI